MKSARELQALVDDLRSLRRLVSESEREIELIRESLITHMETQGLDELSGINYRITYRPVTTNKFDKRKMISAFGESCYLDFCRPVTARRFVLT